MNMSLFADNMMLHVKNSQGICKNNLPELERV
jgi:hypothetical protein